MAIALNIPSQIEKYLSVALFPATGNEFTLYIANDTNRLYQWNGAAYIEVSQQDAVNWGSIGGDIINQTDLQLALAGKVDVEAGKGLSTNDYTTAEKNKLAGIEAGAQVNDVDSVNGYTGAVVLSKSDVGLSNVDNTSDLNKPISTATQNALDAKVPTSRTLTINGVTQDLSANRTFTISTGITIGSTAIASGTVGRVLFQGTGNVVQQSSSLFWDATNNRLGVGTSTPDRILVLQQDGGNFIRMVRNLSTTEFSMAITNVRLGSGSAGGVFFANEYEFRNSAGTSAFLTINSGNVLINTTTDAGFRLDVNGTARVSGQITATADAVINGVNIGIGAGSQVTNTRVGRLALNFNTTGIRNTSVGQEALYANTTGSNNSAFGRGAIAVNTTGGNNSALGQNALFNNTTGNNNTVIGNNSLFAHTTGDSNSVLGADTVSGNFSGSVILGRSATATADNQFVVGSSGTNAGSVTTETNTSTQVWNVVINGVARKILLA